MPIPLSTGPHSSTTTLSIKTKRKYIDECSNNDNSSNSGNGTIASAQNPVAIDAVPVPVPPPEWTRCHAFLHRKSRFCRQEILPSLLLQIESDKATLLSSPPPQQQRHLYCGNHAHLIPPVPQQHQPETDNTSATAASLSLIEKETNDGVGGATANPPHRRLRIPCPVDPTHTIFADSLAQHVVKCPKQKAHQKLSQEYYYCQDCNTGGHDTVNVDTIDTHIRSSQSTNKNLEWAQMVAMRVLQVHSEIFQNTTPDASSSNSSAGKSASLLLDQCRKIGQGSPLPAAPNSAQHSIPNQPLSSVLDSGDFEEDGQVPQQQQHDSLSYNDVYCALPELDLSAQELHMPTADNNGGGSEGLAAAVTHYRIRSGGERHLLQQASIIGHLRRIGALEHIGILPTLPSATTSLTDAIVRLATAAAKPERTILEMGAGRGMTGLVIAGVSAGEASLFKNTRLIMVERGASRSRADKCLRKAATAASQPEDTQPPQESSDHGKYRFQLSSVRWNRIQCDLAHVNMKAVLEKTSISDYPPCDEDATKGGVPSIRDNKQDEIVVVAKHLCGVGTDLALKSLESIQDKVTSCIMATCCHGVCSWSDYVGRSYLVDVMLSTSRQEKQIGNKVDPTTPWTHFRLPMLTRFDEEEFDLLRLWSSGIVKVVMGKNVLVVEPVSDAAVHKTKAIIDENDHDRSNAQLESPTGTEAEAISLATVVASLQLRCGERGLGRACQRLIDYGRQEYLRLVIFKSHNMMHMDALPHVELISYVPESVTPQNAALIAYKRPRDGDGNS